MKAINRTIYRCLTQRSLFYCSESEMKLVRRPLKAGRYKLYYVPGVVTQKDDTLLTSELGTPALINIHSVSAGGVELFQLVQEE